MHWISRWSTSQCRFGPQHGSIGSGNTPTRVVSNQISEEFLCLEKAQPAIHTHQDVANCREQRTGRLSSWFADGSRDRAERQVVSRLQRRRHGQRHGRAPVERVTASSPSAAAFPSRREKARLTIGKTRLGKDPARKRDGSGYIERRCTVAIAHCLAACKKSVYRL